MTTTYHQNYLTSTNKHLVTDKLVKLRAQTFGDGVTASNLKGDMSTRVATKNQQVRKINIRNMGMFKHSYQADVRQSKLDQKQKMYDSLRN